MVHTQVLILEEMVQVQFTDNLRWLLQASYNTTPGTGYTFAYIRVADINTAGGGSFIWYRVRCNY